MSTANPNSPFRRRSFLTAAAVVVLVALLAVIAVLGGLFDVGDEVAPPVTAPSEASPQSAVPADADPSICGLQSYELRNSLTSAPQSRWELVGTIAVPTDDGVGPGVIEDDGFRYCYSHTAQGALYAAANAYALGSDATYRQRIFELAAPGSGRDVMREQTETGNQDAASARLQYAGFAVLSYNGDSATIDLAVNRSNDGQLISLPTKLKWVEGDWKLVVTDDGQSPLSPVAISSLGGYIPWSGA